MAITNWNYYPNQYWATNGTSTAAGFDTYSPMVDPSVNIGYYVAPQPIFAGPIDVSGEFMEVTYAQPMKPRKRMSLFGKMIERSGSDGEQEAVLALNWIKGARQKLTKKEQKEYADRAEKAFKEAVKNMEMGLDKVAKDFEHEMEVALNKAALPAHGYDTFITNKEINEFRNHLPKNKELVIDEIDEYDRPLPREIQKELEKAKKTKLFAKFVIFWVRRVPDPILFGIMPDDKDKFYFIAQWDNDVSIEDFLKYKDEQ